MLAGGPAVGMAGLIAASILADTINGKPVKKVAFNAAQYAISVAAASAAAARSPTSRSRPAPLPFGPEDLPAILGVATIFFVVNSALVSTVVALAQGVINLGRYLANDLFFQASTAGMLLGLSPIVVLAAEFSLPALLLLLLPFLAVHRGGRAAIAKEHQSLHDALTGLPNRTLFRDRIEQAITAGRRADVASAVMLIDLDHFKEINDTLGHHAGDRLLEEVAHRLERSLGERDTVARLGGDEFGVLLPAAAPPRRRQRRRAPAARRPARAVLDRGPHARGRRQHRHGLPPRARHGRGDADPARRHRDVLRQGGRRRARDVRAAPGPLQPAPPVARRRPAPGDPERRDHALLPAQGRARDGHGRRRRGARALGAPAARARRPDRVRADRRADRPDRAADLLRARRRAASRCASGRTRAAS